MTAIRWHQDADGVVVLTLDDPARTVNAADDALLEALGAALDRLEADRDTVAGVIVTSAKPTFLVGDDPERLVATGPPDAAGLMARFTRVKAQLRRLETLGRPVVAAINGSALGGGLELALACHRRIVVDDPRIELGLPDVTLGLLPAAGGVVRSVRLLGLATALTELLLRGQRHRPARARELGLVDELVASPGDLLPAARAWIAAHPDAAQPWDVRGFRIPGGTPATPALAAVLPAFPATLQAQLKGAPYPAPRHILSTAVEGTQVDVDTAFTIESRYGVDLVRGQVARNLVQVFHTDLRAVNSACREVTEVPAPRRVGVLGAGMMGTGIAYVLARAGVEVVLTDVSPEAATAGHDRAGRLAERDVAAGRSRAEDAAGLLARITPAEGLHAVAGADAVVEAVFEDRRLKRQVLAAVEDVVGTGALLCSNTSTLPIDELADGVRHPDGLVGLHFFSPVERMPLVEIVRGPRTGDDAIARALAIVRLLRKTPIVVRDGRGFFTSRVIGTFTTEALAMLAEGVEPASVEQAAGQAGYPAPPLALLDELTLTLPRRIRGEARAAVEAAGGTWTPQPADDVLARMVDAFGRTGRTGGAGFYEYADGRRGRLWPGLREHFGPPDAREATPFGDLKERLLFAEVLEALRCLEEGVVASSADANVGSVLGIGFPGWTGGVLRYVDGYPGGRAGFAARARELAARYGERFTPP